MLEVIAQTPIRDVSVRKPALARPDTKLLDVVTQMRELRRGATLIEDEGGAIVGIFTERDLMLRVNHDDQSWHQTEVSTVMTKNPKPIAQTATLSEALSWMKQGTFRHLPVIDEHGKAVAVVSIRDILAHIVEHYPQEFINLPPDPDHEANKQWGG